MASCLQTWLQLSSQYSHAPSILAMTALTASGLSPNPAHGNPASPWISAHGNADIVLYKRHITVRKTELSLISTASLSIVNGIQIPVPVHFTSSPNIFILFSWNPGTASGTTPDFGTRIFIVYCTFYNFWRLINILYTLIYIIARIVDIINNNNNYLLSSAKKLQTVQRNYNLLFHSMPANSDRHLLKIKIV